MIDISDSDDDGDPASHPVLRSESRLILFPFQPSRIQTIWLISFSLQSALRRRDLPPPPKKTALLIQRSNPRAFQEKIDRRLVETDSPAVTFINTLDDSVPSSFLYTENRIKAVAGGRSLASSQKPKACDCVHCRKESRVNMGTWLTLQVS